MKNTSVLRWSRIIGISLVALLLVLAACSSAEPEPTETPIPEHTATPEPVAEPTEKEPELVPDVTVSQQEILDGTVTVAEVLSDGPGWLVIHAQADGKPGPILGYKPVTDGLNADIKVEIDLAGATETLYAMLHTDGGAIGTWEFPGGPDAPVQVDGRVVTPQFAVTGGLPVADAVIPAVLVADQEIVDGTVTVAEVVSNGPGWLVIHADGEGKPGQVLGYTPVADGLNEDVRIEIDLGSATEMLYAMLHTDGGEIESWEFPGGPDTPVQVDGQVVTPRFVVTGGLPLTAAVLPSVLVADQEIADGAVSIAEVVSDGPGWLVIHAQAEGKPGPVLGYAPVADGLNEGVKVEIDLTSATEVLYAMLHTDGGEIGSWEFPDGPDAPVQVDGQVVTPQFTVTSGQPMADAVTPSVLVADQEIVDGTVTIAEVQSNGPGWLVVHAQTENKPGPILGYEPVADGLNEGVRVEIDLAGATEILYAMLHTDSGEIGTWEFPDGPDAPVQVDGQVVTPAFRLAAAEGDLQIAMLNYGFSPAVVVVKAGTSITWVNQDDGVRHDVHSDTPLFESELLGGGDDYTYVFNEPGLYPYYCRPHGDVGGEGMAGTVVVLPSS
jgi:plastocyanin